MARPAEREPRRRRDEAEDRSEVRAAVQRFTALGLLTFLVVAVPITLWLREEAEAQALDDAVGITERLAQFAVAPLVTEELLAGDPDALAQLDRRLAPWLDDTLLRAKLWDEEGTIVYSDVDELIGQSFGPDQSAREILDPSGSEVSIEVHDDAENAFETERGELVEVYVEAFTGDGQRLMFEGYYDGALVRDEQNRVVLATAPAVVAALAVLQLALLVPAIQLARRLEGHQAVRRRLLQRAVEASDLERRRIARDLHDEVIQDLAGLSYAIEAEELRSEQEHRPLLTRARIILQDNVRALRAMTAELYPPDLDELGLPGALSQLVQPLLEQGTAVTIDLPEECNLDRERCAMLYRVAREALRNVAKHAGASNVTLSLSAGPGRVVLRVGDDGTGFDPRSDAADGHLGLRLIRDTLEEAGGSLEVRSTPGEGTSVTAVLVGGAAR